MNPKLSVDQRPPLDGTAHLQMELSSLGRTLEALDALDPNWDACVGGPWGPSGRSLHFPGGKGFKAIGYIRSKTRMVTLEWPEPRPADAEQPDRRLPA